MKSESFRPEAEKVAEKIEVIEVKEVATAEKHPEKGKEKDWHQIIAEKIDKFQPEFRPLFYKRMEGVAFRPEEQSNFDKAVNEFWRKEFGVSFAQRHQKDEIKKRKAKPPPSKLSRKEIPAILEFAENFEKYILFEDKDVLAINKPGNVATQSSNEVDVIGILRKLRPGAFIAHRLDKETSGVLLIAKNKEALSRLQKQFAKKDILEKNYLAVVSGDIPEHLQEMGVIAPLKIGGGKARVHFQEGKRSQTLYKKLRMVEKDNKKYSLVSVRIFTGRTHQIRVHMAAMGFSIVGDKRYGKEKITGRQMLHAERLKFLHPATNQEMTVIAPLPEDMVEFIGEEK